MAANQVGKTWAGGFEAAMHVTGRYPEDWTGKRFDRPTFGWACGETSEVVRDTVQRVLVGRADSHGTGAIPKDALIDLCLRARHCRCAGHDQGSSMSPAARRLSASRAIHRAARNSRARRWILFGSMKNRRPTSTPKA